MVAQLCERITGSRLFQGFIVLVILANAATIGMETYPSVMLEYGSLVHTLDSLFLGIFVVEIILKLIACGNRPLQFFNNGWNVFDFIIVTAAFIPGLEGQATLLRLIRLLRVLRLLSALPGLQVLVMALVHSIPRIGQMAMLAALLFYIYAVIGVTLFHEHDVEHWGTLHISLLSLFRILTLEDWTDLMYKGMELYPSSWVFFVSFVLFGTFIVFNMLIGIILNSMEEAKAAIAAEHEDPKSRDILVQLAMMQDTLKSMKRTIEQDVNPCVDDKQSKGE